MQTPPPGCILGGCQALSGSRALKGLVGTQGDGARRPPEVQDPQPHRLRDRAPLGEEPVEKPGSQLCPASLHCPMGSGRGGCGPGLITLCKGVQAAVFRLGNSAFKDPPNSYFVLNGCSEHQTQHPSPLPIRPRRWPWKDPAQDWGGGRCTPRGWAGAGSPSSTAAWGGGPAPASPSHRMYGPPRLSSDGRDTLGGTVKRGGEKSRWTVSSGSPQTRYLK